jgi:hypothetical protein
MSDMADEWVFANGLRLDYRAPEPTLARRMNRAQLTILSGGQAGADRAALDWAMAHGVPHGGWCPKGRRAEDGAVPARYALRETPGADYAERTEWNVRDAEATVIFSIGATLSGGSRKTLELAQQYGKPVLHLAASDTASPHAARLRDFLVAHRVSRLNVAGPRASEEAGIADFVNAVLSGALESGKG